MAYFNDAYFNDATWTYWTSTSGTNASSSTDATWASWTHDTWYYWNEEPTSATVSMSVNYVSSATWKGWVEEVDAETRRARNAQRDIDQTWREVEEQERKDAAVIAEETAQALLGELIGDEQLAIYKETGRVIVKGKKHDYLIQKGAIPKILKKDKVQDLCVHLRDRHAVPLTDQIIANILGFKYAEDYMLEVGNLQGESPVNDRVKDMIQKSAVA